MDAIILLIGIPVGFAIGCFLGRKMQRVMWRLDIPYEARVRALRK